MAAGLGFEPRLHLRCAADFDIQSIAVRSLWGESDDETKHAFQRPSTVPAPSREE